MIVAGAMAWGIANVGHWLVVEDPLEKADAVLVLTGDQPFRAMEAARIFNDGWAPAVWLTRDAAPARDAAFAKLGVQYFHEEHYNTLVLQRLGVPPHAIRVLERVVFNTTQELQFAGEALHRAGGRRLVVVTSKPHSRRVRATWRALFTDLDMRVRPTTEDAYRPDGWWYRTRDALDVSREVFGLLNVWAGFPVKPDRQRE